MTDTVKSNEEAMRRKAQATMKPKLLADGYYRWLVLDQKVLPKKDDVPRTVILDVAPLADPDDASTFRTEFKNSIWIKLPTVDGANLTEEEAKTTIQTLGALVPGRIDRFSKEGKQYFFRGEEVRGDAAFRTAREEQLVQAMVIGQEILGEELSFADTAFYAASKQAKNGGRNFVNYISTEVGVDKDGNEREVSEPVAG
jgi:hypothetical protein